MAAGFYSLDLRDPRDRRAARKLSERANGEKRFGKYRSGRGDTSQWANWENFRNGVLNRDQAMGRALTAAWFAAALPAAGRLRFDYVGTTPPSRGMKPVADTKFKNFLTALEINPDENALDMESLGTAQYEHFLEQYGKERYETAAEVEWRRLKESRYRRPVPIEERVDKTEVDPRTLIGSTAGTRSNSQDPTTMGPPAEGQRGGGGGGGGGGAPLQGTGRRRSRSSSLQGGRRRSVSGRSSRLGSKDFGPMEPPISVAPKTALTMGKITKLIKAKSLKTLDEIASLDGSTSSLITKESGATQESLNLHPLFNPLYHRELGTEHPTEAWRRAWFKLLQLQCALCQKGLTVAQVAVLLTKFPRDDLFWVTAIVGLFNTIVDWENMHLVLDELTGEEYLEIAHRLGYLNLINPVHPDRLYAMDLSIPDQRELCSIFARLAIIEPGDNWIHESYRRSWDIVPIPGWELPRGWCEDPENRTGKGLRDFGIVTLTYQSDGANCDPNWAERNFLKSKTLCGSNRPY